MGTGLAPGEGSHASVAVPRRRRQMCRRAAQTVGRAKLHVRSFWSDGAQGPDPIVRAAAGHVQVVAITDHDGVRDVQEARAFALEQGELGAHVDVGEEISTLSLHQLSRHLCIQTRSLIRFLMLGGRRRRMASVS